MAEAFTKENRVKLYYKVCESLPPPTSSEYGPEGGDGLYKLDELLRKHFGRLSLASGGRIETVILNFILSAPEDELLTLIEFIPGTHIIAQVERHNGFMYSAHVRYDANRHAEKLAASLNSFLEHIGSLARFMQDGSFSRDGVAIQVPAVLAKLPDKEALIADLQNLLQADHIVSLLYIDLDNFKAVNDTLGHSEGDRCLERVVEVIGKAIVKKGKVYRGGRGDEFVVLLSNFIAPEAVATAERMRTEIDANNPGASVRVTASVGVASSQSPTHTTPEALLEAADGAMYASKEAGKNRVSLAT